MPVVPPRPYSQFELARIEESLRSAIEKGIPYRYEVFIDNLNVIPRTEDVEMFADIASHVFPGQTKEVIVKIFRHPGQNKNDTHPLTVAPPTTASLNGPDDIEMIVDRRLREEKRSWNHELLEEKHQDLKEKYDKLKQEYVKRVKEVEDQRVTIEEYKNKKLHFGDINVGELAGMWVEGFVRRNPHILHKLPAGESLAGAVVRDNQAKMESMQEAAENQAKSSTAETSETATFERAETPNDPILDRLLEKIKAFPAHLQEHFFHILDYLVEHPANIHAIYQVIQMQEKESKEFINPEKIY